MSRRHRAEKRTVLPDAKYNDLVLAKFMNAIMLDGKKSTAESIVCLLYTSPSPRDQRGSRMPSSA